MMKRLSFTAGFFFLGLLVTASAEGRAPLFLGKSVDGWLRELTDPKAKVRRSAAFALGRIGEDARPAVSALVARLRKDSEASVRDMSASAIGEIVESLKGGNRALWGDTGGALVQALKNDEDAHVRRSAAYALGAFGPNAAGAMESLRAALGDKDASVRQNAAWALGRIGEEAGEAAGSLCERLSDQDALVRRDAAGALGSMGKAGALGAAPLVELLKSERDEVVRKSALDSLSHLAGPEHAKYASGLNPLLQDKDPEVALGAAIVLARIGGPESSGALPLLRKALKDPESHMQEIATAALVNLGPNAEPAMYDLADMLTKTSTPTIVRRNAALAIAHIGAAAKPVVPSLVQALKPTEPLEVRQFASEALAQMKYPANKAAIPAILDTIEKDTDPLVRQKCVWSLFGLDDLRTHRADKVLAKLLEETAPEMTLVRYDAARKLSNVLRDEAPDMTADVLLHMLSNKTLRVYNRTDANVAGATNEDKGSQANVQANLGGDARYMAVEALGWLGKTAKKRADVIEALKKAAKEEDEKLRKAAEKVLKDLEAP